MCTTSQQWTEHVPYIEALSIVATTHNWEMMLKISIKPSEIYFNPHHYKTLWFLSHDFKSDLGVHCSLQAENFASCNISYDALPSIKKRVLYIYIYTVYMNTAPAQDLTTQS